MATSVNYTVSGATEGSSYLVNGFGQSPNSSGSDGDGPPPNPPHPRLTGLGKCHKFPYRCVCCRRNFLNSIPVARRQHIDTLIEGSCSGGTKNCCRLDQRASRGDAKVSNHLKNEISSLVPASSCTVAIGLGGLLGVSKLMSEYDSCTDNHETERSSGLTSSTNLETGDNSHGREQSNDIKKELVQSGDSVPADFEHRLLSVENPSEARRRQTRQTIHQNHDSFSSSSSLHPSYPSPSVPTSPETLKIHHNQRLFEQQPSDNSEERVSLESVNEKEITSSFQENSDCETSFARGDYSKNLRTTDTYEDESQMSFFAQLPRNSPAYPWRPGDSRRRVSRRPGETFKNGVLKSLRALDEKAPADQLTAEPKPHNELTRGWPAHAIPEDVFTIIAKFLSREDLCNLRLVNRECSLKLQDAMFRSVVVPFTTSVFSSSKTENSNAVDSESIEIFEKLGDHIYKFGMSFELDEVALVNPPKKEKNELVYSFYGSYRWHKSGYTRFDDLRKLEEAADQSNRMKRAFSKLKNATELGVVINSGHGWLNAADISDNAIWHEEKSDVFGRRFQPNNCSETKWSIYFENAQSHAINIMRANSAGVTHGREKYLESLTTSSYESYRKATSQPFFHHRQGIILPGIAGRSTINVQEDLARGTLFRIYFQEKSVNRELKKALAQNLEDRFTQPPSYVLGPLTHPIPNLGHKLPNFPLIFSGVNVSADVGGSTKLLSDRVARAAEYPLKPNYLTEPQTEWLRETGWAAKAFMTSYICAIVDNKGSWGQVRTLNLSGISSGLLLNFDRADLFEALPKLAALTVLVIPDWRESEAISSQDGPISTLGPTRAAATFYTFLDGHVGRLERLKDLTIGYIGGGEHATGMFARNQHVLPAPVIEKPRPSVPNADKEGVLTFGSVEKITFKNCWFSPSLLRTFLKNSFALEEIVLESCSLTAPPGGSRSRPRRGPELFPQYPKHLFYLEELRKGTWARILNRFTPGLTLEERHVMSQPDEDLVALRRPDSNLRRIDLKSCGYVRLSDSGFNQNDLPIPDMRSMDYGLHPRYQDLECFMMGHGRFSPLLGIIIQCMGEDEKHLLRLGFGMHFGWGDDLARWRCVEDGFFEGGTGRFSGILERERAESHADGDMLSDDESVPPLERN